MTAAVALAVVMALAGADTGEPCSLVVGGEAKAFFACVDQKAASFEPSGEEPDAIATRALDACIVLKWTYVDAVARCYQGDQAILRGAFANSMERGGRAHAIAVVSKIRADRQSPK